MEIVNSNTVKYNLITNSKGMMIYSKDKDKVINEFDAFGYDFELLGMSENKKSIIRFKVNKFVDSDEDETISDSVVPFVVAYAVSIHKSQGLEYSSVKIIITKATE